MTTWQAVGRRRGQERQGWGGQGDGVLGDVRAA